MTKATSHLSLAQAQKIALEKREASRAARLEVGLPVDIALNQPNLIEPQPPATAWAATNALAYVDQLRQLNGLDQSPNYPIFDNEPDEKTAVDPQPTTDDPLTGSARILPDVATAALNAKETADLRLWLIAMHLSGGQGNIDLAQLKTAVCSPDSPHCCYGPYKSTASRDRAFPLKIDRFSQRGFGHIGNNGRLYLNGQYKLAIKYDLLPITTPSTTISLDILVNATHGQLNAEIYNRWIAGRQEKPISRWAIEQATGIPERTQRHYDRVAGIERQTNIAIERPYSPAAFQEVAAKHGMATFILTDWLGQHGPPNRRYIAIRLPNSYTTAAPKPAGKTAKKRLNRRIKQAALSDQRPMLTSLFKQMFFSNPGLAVSAYNRDSSLARYYPATGVGGGTINIWHVIG